MQALTMHLTILSRSHWFLKLQPFAITGPCAYGVWPGFQVLELYQFVSILQHKVTVVPLLKTSNLGCDLSIRLTEQDK